MKDFKKELYTDDPAGQEKRKKVSGSEDYQKYYDTIKDQLPPGLEGALHMHDNCLLKMEFVGKDYHMDFDPTHALSRTTKLIFKNAVIVENDEPEPEEICLLTNIFLIPDGYELHMYFEGYADEKTTRKQLILQASDILFEMLFINRGACKKCGAMVSDPSKEGYESRGSKGCYIDHEFYCYPCIIRYITGIRTSEAIISENGCAKSMFVDTKVKRIREESKAGQDYIKYYDSIKQQFPPGLEKALIMYNNKLIESGFCDKDYHMVFDPTDALSNTIKLILKNAVILSDDEPVAGACCVYNEIYLTSNGYELRMIFETRIHDDVERKKIAIQADDILFEVLFGNIHECARCGVLVSYPFEENYEYRVAKGIFFENEWLCIPCTFKELSEKPL